jgi:hypothetical protein
MHRNGETDPEADTEKRERGAEIQIETGDIAYLRRWT